MAMNFYYIGTITNKTTAKGVEEAKAIFTENREAIINAWNSRAKEGAYSEMTQDGGRDYRKWLVEFMNNCLAVAGSKSRCKVMTAIDEAYDKTCKHIANYYTYAERQAKYQRLGL